MEPINQASRPQAKYFFLQLGIIALTYTAVATFIAFMFDIINYVFPDQLAYAYDPYSTSLRFSVSVLIVVFPVLIYLSRTVFRMLQASPEDRSIAVRRWLSYLTLFLSGAMILVDLIVIINTFLNGEITTRFIMKCIVVLAVACAVFWYTIRELRGIYFEKPQLLKLFTYITSIIVIASIVGGFFIIGSPASQRKVRNDLDRTNDLSTIQNNVLYYYQRSGSLPVSLDNLKDDFSYQPYETTYLDPVTDLPYEYAPVTGTTSIAFELCATFDLASQYDMYEGRGQSKIRAIDYYGGYDYGFEHEAGRNCFTRTIDPIKYPVDSK